MPSATEIAAYIIIATFVICLLCCCSSSVSASAYPMNYNKNYRNGGNGVSMGPGMMYSQPYSDNQPITVPPFA